MSKRADSQYRLGKSSAWLKIKCPHWRKANRDRHERFLHVERNSSDLASAGPTQRPAMI